jgi:hypothetical protein
MLFFNILIILFACLSFYFVKSGLKALKSKGKRIFGFESKYVGIVELIFGIILILSTTYLIILAILGLLLAQADI